LFTVATAWALSPRHQRTGSDMAKKQLREARLNVPQGGALGEDVRRVREARGISQSGLGGATGYSKSYVSKVESGSVFPSERFVKGCDKAFGTGDLFARQHRRITEGEHPAWFAPFIQTERLADSIEDYSTLFIFGLLQTPAYARAALEASAPGAAPRDIEAKVAGRIRRRAILEREDPRAYGSCYTKRVCGRTSGRPR
jgi:transcriptional regulator with XRE-family HTH domain